MNKVFGKLIDFISPPTLVYAHCDIPCGIYDPHNAQMAAHTVIRMTTLINELPEPKPDWKKKEADSWAHKLSRYTSVKEEHAELVNREIRILWADYFKPEHLNKHPKLHEIVWNILKTASKARQEVDIQVADKLLDEVNTLAEIFWQTKNMGHTKFRAPYPTERETVYPTSKKN
ncbi:MAG: superoxide dismutase, Ni [Candidatus Woykebacteria bacterium]